VKQLDQCVYQQQQQQSTYSNSNQVSIRASLTKELVWTPVSTHQQYIGAGGAKVHHFGKFNSKNKSESQSGGGMCVWWWW
jgi:hypothetical protein